MCEILPYIDFEKIRNSEPKWFFGYSDNTNLIFLLATLCDTDHVQQHLGWNDGMTH